MERKGEKKREGGGRGGAGCNKNEETTTLWQTVGFTV